MADRVGISLYGKVTGVEDCNWRVMSNTLFNFKNMVESEFDLKRNTDDRYW